MILIVGEVVLDVGFDKDKTEAKLRLGGALHACRALWAMRIPYALSYISPDYLDDQVEDYATRHGAHSARKIGSISGSPSVILIHDIQETTSQGYELLLRDAYRFRSVAQVIDESAPAPTDIMIFPGQYELGAILVELSQSDARVHIDWSNTSESAGELQKLERPIETVFTSTSSQLFREECAADPSMLVAEFSRLPAKALVLKENRGGARYISSTGRLLDVGAQLRPVQHSVGVGDCFDVAFVALVKNVGAEAALAYASWIAAEYATTTYPDDFREQVRRCLAITKDEISEIPGVRLPWEDRPEVHIYLAAPDFDYMDTQLVEHVNASLRYHNFSPHRPVREHGQAQPESTLAERLSLCQRDIELINRCAVLVAIVQDTDPGTLIELGLAAGLKKPTLVLDPQGTAINPMILGVPTAVCRTVDELLVRIFEICGKTQPVTKL